MAGSSKEALARSFKRRLQELDCPYVDGVDESWITELLFQPGEARIRLLQWLLSRYDSKLAEMLDNQYAHSQTQTDSRLQRLLQILSLMGMCRADDIELVRGASSASRQTAFWDQLLDILCIADAADNPQKRAMASPGIVSESLSLEEQFEQDGQYISTLAAQRELKDIFSPKLHLFPPDLTRLLDNSLKEQGLQGQRVQPPDKGKLDEVIKNLNKEIQSSEAQLMALKKQYDFPRSDTKAVAKVSQTLRLVLSELAQLMTSFSYCFENELRQWCNKSPPKLTGLGPAVKRVHSLLHQFSTLLDGLKRIQTSHAGICSREPCATDKTGTGRLDNLVGVSQTALASFQECASILDESLHRQGEEWDTSSALGSTFWR